MIIIALLAGLVLALAYGLIEAWLLMLALGALHSYFPDVPALGFWPVFWALVAINIIAAVVKGILR